MDVKLRFLLNGVLQEITQDHSLLTLDWLRREQKLTGTKEGCREGDCGACLVLLGQKPLEGADYPIEWIPVTSCLLPLDELDGRHLITIEGLSQDGPGAIAQILHGENASQCGFCSPGIVVALTARLIAGGPVDSAALDAALEGNLCRCTGYASIRRSSALVAQRFADLSGDYGQRIAALAQRGVLPPVLAQTMVSLPKPAGSPRSDRLKPFEKHRDTTILLGGGTDYLVRHGQREAEVHLEYLDLEDHYRAIFRDKDTLVLGSAVTDHDFFTSTEVQKLVPGIEALEAEVASPAIRSRATLGGNIANASPVADMTAMLIALGARVRLWESPSGKNRDLPVEDLFTGYKKLALREDERIAEIRLPEASRARAFSFEKAAKRARLDIAAVNTAMACDLETGLGSRLRNVRISAGGVGPVPQFLRQTSALAEGQEVSPDLVRELCRIAVQEIHPISDVRGSAEYRTTMIERFIIAHFLRLFPESHLEEELFK